MPWVITGYDDDGEPLVEWVDESETETPVTEVVLPDLRTADLRPGDPYYTGPELPDLSGIPSGIFTGGDYDFWADIGINPDTTMENWKSPSNAEIEESLKGNYEFGALFRQLGSKALDLFKTNGEYDPKKLLALAGGAYAASRPSGSTPTGYQGKIPKLTATSNMLTAPPVGRRPGSGGINYGGGATFRDETGKIVSSNEKTLAELLKAAQDNPYNRPSTYENPAYNRPPVTPTPGGGGGGGGGGGLPDIALPKPSTGGYTPPPPKKDTSGFTTGAGDTGNRFDPFKPSLPEGTTMAMDPSTRVGNTVTTDGVTRGYDPLRGTMFTNAEVQARADKELADRQVRREAMRNGTYVEPEFSTSSQNTAPISQGTPGFVAPIYNAAILPPKDQPFVNPYASSLANPNTIPLMSGESQDQGLARLQSQSNELEARIARKAAMRANMGSDGVAVGMAAGGLAPEGFVVPADVVSHLGNGSSDAGLKLLVSKFGAKPIKGEGDGMSDSIPTTIGGKQEARVANDEAFISPEMVKRIGGGDAEKGAKKLYAMMDRVREERTGTTEQGKQIDPNKFMPGGSVKKYATGGTTTPAGATGSESSLSNWAGDYVTGMLGQGQALANKPYEAYTGPLTAGASGLQNQAFGMAAGLKTPGAIGQAATTAGGIASMAPGAGQYTAVGSDFGNQQAQQYMNPYLQSALNPAMDEARRQADISRMADAGRLTQAGAFGGSRQAIMESEGRRNLMDKQNQMLTSGYSTAFDKAQQQFNADQARKIQEQQFGTTSGLQGLQTGLQGAQTQGQLGNLQSQADLAGLSAMSGLGGVQRGIESEGIAADKAQFEEARLNPYKMVQFQQSLLSGLPLAAQSYNIPGASGLQQFAGGATTIDQLLKILTGQQQATAKN
jgi:hypothetical protein